MTCYQPVQLHARQGGGGTMSLSARWSDRSAVTVACGTCIGCQLAYRRQWGVRGALEAQMHQEASFLTLTYADEHYPEDGCASLRPVQLFMKRLRVCRPSSGDVSYIACSEYGSQSWRAHHHVVLYGEAFLNDRYLWRQNDRGDRIYRSPSLEKLWPYGHSEIGSVTVSSVGYTVGYCTKKIEGRQDPDQYMRAHPVTGEFVRLTPEALTMSRNPAIGLRWLRRFLGDVYPSDFLTIQGQKYGVPRFFDRKIADAFDPSVEPDKLHGALRDMREKLDAAGGLDKFNTGLLRLKADRWEGSLERRWDHTPERLAVRHESAYLNKFSRLARPLE